MEYDAAHPTAPLITNKEGNMNSYVGYDSDANLFITLSQQYGYGYTSVDEYGEAHLDYNNANMKNLMKTFADASKNGYLRSPGVIGYEFFINSVTAICSFLMSWSPSIVRRRAYGRIVNCSDIVAFLQK